MPQRNIALSATAGMRIHQHVERSQNPNAIKPMTQWPWIAIVLAVFTFFNPIGLEFIHAAFLSGEQLSRNIAQPFVFSAMFILAALGACEWWLKRWLRRRRAKRSEAQHMKVPQ